LSAAPGSKRKPPTYCEPGTISKAIPSPGTPVAFVRLDVAQAFVVQASVRFSGIRKKQQLGISDKALRKAVAAITMEAGTHFSDVSVGNHHAKGRLAVDLKLHFKNKWHAERAATDLKASLSKASGKDTLAMAFENELVAANANVRAGSAKLMTEVAKTC